MRTIDSTKAHQAFHVYEMQADDRYVAYHVGHDGSIEYIGFMHGLDAQSYAELIDNYTDWLAEGLDEKMDQSATKENDKMLKWWSIYTNQHRDSASRLSTPFSINEMI